MLKRTMSIGFLGRVAMVRIVSMSVTFLLRSMKMCEKSIGQKFEKSLSSRTGPKPERVSNRQAFINDLTVLHVL